MKLRTFTEMVLHHRNGFLKRFLRVKEKDGPWERSRGPATAGLHAAAVPKQGCEQLGFSLSLTFVKADVPL